jgi:hypothetical protein
MRIEQLVRSSIIATTLSLSCFPGVAAAQSEEPDMAASEDYATDSSDPAQSAGDAGSDRQPDWVECWRRFLESHEGGKDWRAEWYYDGTCGY